MYTPSRVQGLCSQLTLIQVDKESSVPNSEQWASWLKTNLPPTIRDIRITSNWASGSAVVDVVMPIEVWLGLKQKEAYSFINYFY